MKNIRTLDTRVEDLTYTVDQISNGSKGLLDEVATGKITGEEDIWSHTDLWDFQANVDGARVAYETLKPLLEVKDPALSKEIAHRFTALQKLLDQLPRRGGRLRLLRHGRRGPAQAARHRRRRALRAAVEDDRGPHAVTGGDGTSTARGALSRRRLLGAAGVGALGVGAGVGGFAVARADEPAAATPSAYPFHGEHQAGIVTPAQDRLHFAAFDVTTDSRAELVALLAGVVGRRGADDGRPAGRLGRGALPYDSPAADTGEAIGLPASRLTVTIGFGPTLFEKDGEDRFGLADRRPAALQELPHFPSDNLDPARSDGDLCVQACADDPQVAVHAIRNLARIGFGTVAVRWAQLGYGRTSSTSTSQSTPRNLFGFKDGTANLKAEERADLERFVWVRRGADPQAAWMTGGLLPRRPPDQHAHRDLGPHQPQRAGDPHRPRPPRGRAAVRGHRAQRARLRPRRAAAGR